jgi:hypothetical protein
VGVHGETAMECNYPDFPSAVQDKKTGIIKKGGKRFFRRAHFFPKR